MSIRAAADPGASFALWRRSDSKIASQNRYSTEISERSLVMKAS